MKINCYNVVKPFSDYNLVFWAGFDDRKKCSSITVIQIF